MPLYAIRKKGTEGKFYIQMVGYGPGIYEHLVEAETFSRCAADEWNQKAEIVELEPLKVRRVVDGNDGN